MSNYVQSTNFATKDSLPSGDPLKIVKGTEINTEFANIAIAVATKADLNSPTLVTPALGTPSSGTLTNCTSLPIDGGTTGTLPVSRGGTGVTTSTGSGNVVLSTSPTLVTPVLGTPTSGTLTNCTSLPIDGGTTGTLPVARGGTGVTTSTGSGSVVLSASPAFTGTPTAPTASTGTNTTQLATTAFVKTEINAAQAFPSGTAMLFVQTSAPTGWTKSTTHDNKALRIVSGAASSGGSSAFSTVFTNQTPTISNTFSVGNTTLTTTQIPSHTHTITGAVTCGGFGVQIFGQSGGSLTSNATGGGGSHNHSLSGSATSSAITLDVQYVDVIIATKN